MIQTNQTCDVQESYEEIVRLIRELYKGGITDQEAHEAARNLIGFYRTLLAMAVEQGLF